MMLCLLCAWPVSAQSTYDALGYKTPFYDPTVDTTGSCGGSTTLSGNENSERVWRYLTSKGLQPHQAAGIMGNLQAEGHFEPRLVEYGFPNSRGEISKAGQPSSLDDDIPPNANSKGQPGYGIVQWTSPGRKDGLRNLSKTQNAKPSDLGLQLDYLWQELNGPYKNSTLTPLQASTTVEEATDIFLEHYEVPANIGKQRPIRENNARQWLAKYGSGTDTTTTPTAPAVNNCASSNALDTNGCPVNPIPQSETVIAQGTQIRVHPCIADEVARVIQLAHEQGLNLSGWGWRDNSTQIKLRGDHGCGGSRIYDSSCKGSPPTAVPGKSRHESGSAVDFTCDGKSIPSRSHPCFTFLRNNTSLKNLESEPWHWSADAH